MNLRSSEPYRSLSIVLIDDDEDHLVVIREAMERTFAGEQLKLTFTCFTHPAVGLAELPDHDRQVILLDYQFPGSTGIDWIPDFMRASTSPIIILTSSGDEHIAAEAFREGASDYVVKSDIIEKPSMLRRVVRESLRKNTLERTNRDLARELKRANAELSQKNERLTELTDTAHRFVENVAHEFRTPLTVIKEFASIISDGIGGEVTPKQQEHLAHIMGSAGDLAELVNDFLNCSRLRSNLIRVHRERVSIEEMISSVWPILQTRAAAKPANLEYAIQPDLPKIFADPDKAQRALINLVINAIKYSDAESEIRVSAALEEGDMIRISVQDRGPGLPPDSVQHLFERFQQGEPVSGQLADGFGLGLSIVKEMVAINLGQVGIESTVGQGSVFSFTLPIADTSSIIGAFVQRAQNAPEPRQVTVLSAEASRRCPIGKLVSSLSDVSLPFDLCLSAPGGSNAFLLGQTNDAQQYRDRVEQAINERNGSDTHHTGPIQVGLVGHWPPDHAQEALAELFDTREETEEIDAQISTHR
ncbi:MAG: hybrid sensor histidine kinase/response regulator [bacterium]|nr:hybrid sensor histidine kinase/response regulator [bacterium]